MAALLAFLALSAPLQLGCTLAQPAVCISTNSLFATPAFEAAVRRFAGKGRSDWLDHGNRASQLVEMIGGPPEPPVLLANGIYRLAACRPHSCWEKGALFVSGGVIRAAAVLHFACGRGKACADDYTLSIVIHGNDPALVVEARRWAAGAIAVENMYPGQSLRLGSVEMVDPGAPGPMAAPRLRGQR